MPNIQQQYHNRVIVLQNLLDRIVPSRGREKAYSLKGVVTLEERNAIVVALSELKVKSLTLSLPGEEKGGQQWRQ